jgi:hypothetical protein
MPGVAEDVVAITAVLSRYSMAMDLRQWELMDQVFTPDGEIFFQRSPTAAERSRRGADPGIDRMLFVYPSCQYHRHGGC